jgi:hypothetical protein
MDGMGKRYFREVRLYILNQTSLREFNMALFSRPSLGFNLANPLAGVGMAFVASILAAAAPAVHSEELNLNEKADTSAMVLDPLSFGLTVGGLAALNEDLRNESETFLELGVDASILFAEHFNMGLQFNWLLPGQSKGGGLTLDYLLGSGAFRPFIGAGIGIQYMDEGKKFGDAFGIAGRGHAGILFDVMDEMQLRIRVPFIMVGNENADQLVGVDFSILFSGPHRHTKVKKLTY